MTKALTHLGVDEVTVEAIKLAQPEVVTLKIERRLRRILSNHRPVLSQSNHSGSAALRLGVTELCAATVAEKDQRNSLLKLFGACAGV